MNNYKYAIYDRLLSKVHALVRGNSQLTIGCLNLHRTCITSVLSAISDVRVYTCVIMLKKYYLFKTTPIITILSLYLSIFLTLLFALSPASTAASLSTDCCGVSAQGSSAAPHLPRSWLFAHLNWLCKISFLQLCSYPILFPPFVSPAPPPSLLFFDLPLILRLNFQIFCLAYLISFLLVYLLVVTQPVVSFGLVFSSNLILILCLTFSFIKYDSLNLSSFY